MNILRKTSTERVYPNRWSRTLMLLCGSLITASAVGEMLFDDTWTVESGWIPNFLIEAGILTMLLA